MELKRFLSTVAMRAPAQRLALLYVAGRFMAVRIDYCAKRQATSGKLQASGYEARYSCWTREEYHYNGRVVVQMVKHQATSVKLQATSSKQQVL